MIGHWAGGLGIAGHDGGCAVFSGVGIVAGDRGRDRLDHAAGDVSVGYPKRFAAGIIVTVAARSAIWFRRRSSW